MHKYTILGNSYATVLCFVRAFMFAEIAMRKPTYEHF